MDYLQFVNCYELKQKKNEHQARNYEKSRTRQRTWSKSMVTIHDIDAPFRCVDVNKLTRYCNANPLWKNANPAALNVSVIKKVEPNAPRVMKACSYCGVLTRCGGIFQVFTSSFRDWNMYPSVKGPWPIVLRHSKPWSSATFYLNKLRRYICTRPWSVLICQSSSYLEKFKYMTCKPRFYMERMNFLLMSNCVVFQEQLHRKTYTAHSQMRKQ